MASSQRTFQSETSEQRKRRLKNECEATYYRKRQRNRQNNSICIRHHELGRMDQIYTHCSSKFWIEEKNHDSRKTSPSFAVCYAGGKVNLPPLLKPPSSI
jgi:hypothetical protein